MKTPFAITALLVSTSAFATVAMAQTDPNQNSSGASAATTSSEADHSNDIIVTAQKREQRLSDVPVSVTALSGAQLVSKGINNVEDLVKVTPGLSFVDSGKSAPVFSLRGVGFFDNALGARPTVTVYLDEAPLPFSIEAKAASFDLERVEVLKGPQGTLFGQSSTGGAINYISAKPTDTLQAGVTASYGRFNTVEAQGYVSGPLSSTLTARFAFHTIQSGDWQYSYTRHETMGRQNLSQARLQFEWKPSDKLKVLLNVNGTYDGSDNQAPQFIGTVRSNAATPLLLTYPIAPRDPRAADWNPGQKFRRDNRFIQAILRADYKASDTLTLTSLTSYSHEKVRTDLSDGMTLNNFNVLDFGHVWSFTQELRAAGDVGKLQYIVGANYQRDRTNETTPTYETYGTSAAFGDAIGPVDNQYFSTVAVFGDATYQLAERIRLSAGVRYTKQDLDYNGCLTTHDASSAAAYLNTINFARRSGGLPPLASIAVGQCVSLDATRSPAQAVGSLDESNVSWRVGVDFKPTPRTLLYANVSKGYKAGSIPNPGATSTDQFKPVVQESVLAYEAGIKSSMFNHMIDFTGAAFYYDYKNKQLLGRTIFTPNIFGPQSAVVNIPKSRIFGAEAQVVLHPGWGLTLDAAGTYIDTKIQSNFLNYSLVGVQSDFINSKFPYTPKWQYVFDGEERFAISPTVDGVLGANANYRTKTVAGFGGDPRLNIDAYWLVDLRAGVEDPHGKWKAQLYGRNVFNKYYWNNVNFGGDTLRRYVGMPATYGVQLSYKF